ncbi:hypothetical protein LLG07_05990 [bacterium]|nr:hypothetical protein [bacterium]
MKNKSRIINEVNKIISEELLFLSRHYEYDLKQYYLPGLIYGSCLLTFFNLEEAKNSSLNETIPVNNYYKDKEEQNLVYMDTYRILNLITGFELLGIGINIHDTAESVIIKDIYPEKKELIEDYEKNYTLKLLFGDIFYSRAVIYLINYNDFFVSEDILNSLLVLHNSRLIIHQIFTKIIAQNSEGKVYKKFMEAIPEIKNLNALLKSAFLTGFSASGFKPDFDGSDLSFRIIDNLVSFKTYSDIENHLKQICSEIKSDYKDMYLNFIFSKKIEITNKINRDIAIIKPQWLKNNFNSLIKLFQAL